MSYLLSAVRYEDRKHPVTYTATRFRVSRSTDGGQTWEDVRTENLPLGAQPPAYVIPENAAAGEQYRLGFAPTNGKDVGPEVFGNIVGPEPRSIQVV